MYLPSICPNVMSLQKNKILILCDVTLVDKYLCIVEQQYGKKRCLHDFFLLIKVGTRQNRFVIYRRNNKNLKKSGVWYFFYYKGHNYSPINWNEKTLSMGSPTKFVIIREKPRSASLNVRQHHFQLNCRTLWPQRGDRHAKNRSDRFHRMKNDLLLSTTWPIILYKSL